MAATTHSTQPDQRPDFMVELGLSPPYTPEDVKVAYLTKAKKVHPDHGGSVAEFRALQEAFEKAKQYTDFRIDRRHWIASQLTETITTIRLADSLRADELVDTMVEERDSLGGLTHLALPGCRLSDAAAQRLEAFKQLKHLDLSNTPITNEALWFVDELPALESLNLDGTQVGWWMKRKVKKLMQIRHDAKPVTPFDV
jgi:hypothetical protein